MSDEKKIDLEILKLQAAERKAKGEFYEAMGKVQKELKTVQKTKRGYNYNYAPIEECYEQLQPVLAKHGFTLLQPLTYDAEFKALSVTSILGFKNGIELTGAAPILPQDMSNPQKVGSYVTYMRRYSGISITGLRTAEEDDDGAANVTQPSAPPTSPSQGTKTRVKANFDPKMTTPQKKKVYAVLGNIFGQNKGAQTDCLFELMGDKVRSEEGGATLSKLTVGDASKLIEKLTKIEDEKPKDFAPPPPPVDDDIPF